MKQLTFVAAIFLVLVIGFTNGGGISADDFAIDGTSFVALNFENGPNVDQLSAVDQSEFIFGDIGVVLNAATDYDNYNPIYFDDFFNDETSPELYMVKKLLRDMLPSIKKKLNETGIRHPVIRYQDNRFWNLTFLPIDNEKMEYLHYSVLVNLEVKNKSQTNIDSLQEQYDPLPGQYKLELSINLTGVLPEKVRPRNGVLHSVTKVADSKHPDGVQMNILKKVLPQIQEKVGFQVRYGRFLLFKSISTENITENGQHLQVVTILEKQTTFCRDTYPQHCPYGPIHYDQYGAENYIQVKQYNDTVVLEDFN